MHKQLVCIVLQKFDGVLLKAIKHFLTTIFRNNPCEFEKNPLFLHRV
ncbi:MAG: hypothetical protein JG782_1439 [Anaerophaga sp.]|nr:hypothetical protein [Anaerophaga sp.]MDI3520458.1 hypothetical protein [Anaerophaga sp.]